MVEHSASRVGWRSIADPARPDLIVTPEFVNHCLWYADTDHCFRVAGPLDGPFLDAVAAKTREHHCYIVVNCTVQRRNNAMTGTNVLFGPEGKRLATADKQVLMGNENNFLERAPGLSPVIATPIGRLGMYSCMDSVINEPPRVLALGGAQVLCNTLNSFANEEASLHIPVRAAENRVFVVAANKSGPLVPAAITTQVAERLKIAPERLHGAGESQIVAPEGAVLARAPVAGEVVAVADIDVTLADDKRHPDGTDVFTARRPSLYGAIAEPPGERHYVAKSGSLVVAIYQPREEGARCVPEVAKAVAQAAGAGVRLIVLPKLFFMEGGRVGDPREAVRRSGESGIALAAALVESTTMVVCSTAVRTAGGRYRHEAVAITGTGILARQAQIHTCRRHAEWITDYGEDVEVTDVPWGRLALIVGDDAVYPETFRLAVLKDADVGAAPMTVLERWEIDTGLVERAAENRLTVIAASRPGAVGASVIVAPDKDFTLWTAWSRPFDGNINMPNVTRAAATPGLTPVTVDPSTAANRTVTLKTDVVASRPYWLLGPLVGR